MPDIVFINETPHDSISNAEFDRLMQRVGLNKSKYRVLSIIDTKLYNDWFGVMYQDKGCLVPSAELIEAWKVLEIEIAKIKPNVIVPLGEFALRAVCNLRSIGKWRGSIVVSKWGGKCIPTLSPSHILKEYIMRPVMIKDLQKAKSEAYHSLIRLPKRDLIIRPSVNQICDYFQQIVKSGKCAVDIETQWYKNISCIGFSYDKSSALCVPFVAEGGQYWSDSQEAEIRGYVDDILRNPNIEKYGQNFHFDWCYLKRDGFIVNNYAFDTRVAQHCIAPELPADLGFLTSIYTNEPYYKDEGKDWRKVKDFNRYFTYNCKDAAVTREIVDAMKSEIVSFGHKETFDFEMSLIPEFVDSTLKGMKYDVELRDNLKHEKKKELDIMVNEFNDNLPNEFQCVKCKGVGEIGKSTIKECPKCGGVGNTTVVSKGRKKVFTVATENITKICRRCKGSGQVGKSTLRECPTCEGRKQFINLNSPTQIKSLIYDKMKLPKILKRNTGKASTDIETLVKLQVKHPNPIFKKLIDYSKLSKQIEFLNTKIDNDNRIRTTLGCFGELGRLKSSKNPFGTGTNLQCVERGEFRKLFLPDEGYLMYGGDFSQAEARIVAYESMDLDYIKIFEDYDAGIGEKIHTINAQTIFEKNEISIDEYQLGKRICHGLNYLMGVRTLCDYVLKELGENYAITEKEARRFSEAYFARFKGIKKWHETIFEELKTTRTLTNCFGRKRPFLGRIDATMHRKGVAYKPQSGVADLTNHSILRIKEQVPECEFLHQDHDELIFQAPLTCETKIVKQRLVNAMTIPITINGLTFTIPVDMKAGRSWGELE